MKNQSQKDTSALHTDAVRLEALAEGLIELIEVKGAENAVFGTVQTIAEKASSLANGLGEICFPNSGDTTTPADAQKELLAALEKITALPEGSDERAEKLKELAAKKHLSGTIIEVAEEANKRDYRDAFNETDTIITNLVGLHHSLDKLAWDDFNTSDPHCTALTAMIKLLGSELKKLEEGRSAEWKASLV